MRHRQRVAPTLNGEGTASAKAAPSKSSRFATQDEPTAEDRAEQGDARRCEGLSRRHALAALLLGGGLAFQERSLAGHYANRAVALHRGGGQ